jgi:hypothetical protein
MAALICGKHYAEWECSSSWLLAKLGAVLRAMRGVACGPSFPWRGARRD